MMPMFLTFPNGTLLSAAMPLKLPQSDRSAPPASAGRETPAGVNAGRELARTPGRAPRNSESRIKDQQ
jgi:hypothetical protein